MQLKLEDDDSNKTRDLEESQEEKDKLEAEKKKELARSLALYLISTQYE